MRLINSGLHPPLLSIADSVTLRGARHVLKISISSDYAHIHKATGVSDENDGRLVRAARFFQQHGARLGYGIVTLILSALGLVTSALTFSGLVRVGLFVLILVLIAVAAYLFVQSIRAEDKRTTDIEDLEVQVAQLEREKGALEDTLGSVQEQYTTLFAGLLSILANQVLGYGPTERVSVYRHDSNKSGFRMVSRYSDNPEFNKPSERTFYPDDEGAIGAAWNEGRLVIAELPDAEKDLNNYLKYSEQDWRIKSEVAQKFTMKSCCYAAFPLRHPHGSEYGHIAVAVFESTEKNSLRIEKLKEEINGPEGERIAKFLVTMEAIEPRVDIASDEGV